jgi:tetratricopeptide (TPR) repeat protein
MFRKSFLGIVLVVIAFYSALLSAQAQRAPKASKTASVTITTKPNAIVWIDEIRRGLTDSAGMLQVSAAPGRHLVRVRASGFRETVVPLLSGRRSLTIKLIESTDPAELLFQKAEDAREKAHDDSARGQAADLYRQALKLRAAYPAAHVGLARVLMDLNQFREALSEIEAARRTRPAYAEASAVEGRINREAAFTDQAIESFRRSLREAGGFQPEAHVGLARVLEEKGQYDEAISEYRKAIDQLADTEPVIYQLLGATYEHQQRYKEALSAYEKYLALAPNGSLAPAIRSIIEQLRRDAAGQEIVP